MEAVVLKAETKRDINDNEEKDYTLEKLVAGFINFGYYFWLQSKMWIIHWFETDLLPAIQF